MGKDDTGISHFLRGRISSQMVAVDLDAVIPTVQDQQLPLGCEGDAHWTGKTLSNKDTIATTLGKMENFLAAAISHNEVTPRIHTHASDAAEILILRKEVADLPAKLPVGAHRADGEATLQVVFILSVFHVEAQALGEVDCAFSITGDEFGPHSTAEAAVLDYSCSSVYSETPKLSAFHIRHHKLARR